ncbi:MAG: tryptophan--tRNA ligase, partial [SAR324 cluster bacterium]|nr:tryptophan--tRNA ligase [SAR324 cluster bacterium]
HCNVFQIFRQFADETQREAWAKRYRAGGMGYGEIKQATFEAINEAIRKPRERYFAVREDTAQLDAILAEGGERARQVAGAVLYRARKRVGLS